MRSLGPRAVAGPSADLIGRSLVLTGRLPGRRAFGRREDTEKGHDKKQPLPPCPHTCSCPRLHVGVETKQVRRVVLLLDRHETGKIPFIRCPDGGLRTLSLHVIHVEPVREGLERRPVPLDALACSVVGSA